MKPEIKIDDTNKIITLYLKENMSKEDIYLSFDELNALLKSEEYKDYVCLSDATEKSYQDLDCAMELSDNIRDILAYKNIKMAYVRPQADYISDNSEMFVDRFKIFDNKNEATKWLCH